MVLNTFNVGDNQINIKDYNSSNFIVSQCNPKEKLKFTELQGQPIQKENHYAFQHIISHAVQGLNSIFSDVLFLCCLLIDLDLVLMVQCTI